MRLFIAVELDEALRRAAAGVAERLSGLGQAGGRRAITWVAAQNLHLTLRFLGEVEPSIAKGLVERLAPPFATRAFDLAVSGVGVFPPSGPPRVIWLGIPEGGTELRALHDEIEARLEGLGFEREDRPFRAHLTLGRVRAPLGPAARQALAAARVGEVGRCRVDHVTLFESRLSPKGPAYTALAKDRLIDD